MLPTIAAPNQIPEMPKFSLLFDPMTRIVHRSDF
jgi:hypothetical protein